MTQATPSGERYARHLTESLLPFWLEHSADTRYGGFFGGLNRDGSAVPSRPKGLVQHARFLWSFSAAYRAISRSEYRLMADRAFDFLRKAFYDPVEHGWYYLVSADGTPLNRVKHLYGQSFVIYGLSEYFLATGQREALDLALETFRTIDSAGHDARWSGYNECFSRQWQPIEQHPDLGVGGDRKTMNTHIHLLESFTTLYKACADNTVALRLGELIDLCLHTIVDVNQGRSRLFFERDWTPLPGPVSYGHDIELSWLLTEAARALAFADSGAVDQCSLSLARAVQRNGLDAENGGLFYEGNDLAQPTARQKVWWVQAEALVGFLNARALSGDDAFWDSFLRCSTWIWNHQIDSQYGEWHDTIEPDGTVSGEKAGLWKTPYHTARACLQVVRRLAQADPRKGS